MPRWVRLVVRLPVLLEELRDGKATLSSGSSGVESGGGNWMLVRSGSEPPVLCAAGSTEGFNSWSGDGKILKKKKKKKIKEAVIKLLSLPLLKEFLALTHDATELHKTNFAVRILGGSTCASSGHLQTALFFMNHQKWVALLQSRRDETSAPVRRRKRRRRMCSCEGSSENQCDVTEERAPGICSLTGCKKKNVCYQQQQELT